LNKLRSHWLSDFEIFSFLRSFLLKFTATITTFTFPPPLLQLQPQLQLRRRGRSYFCSRPPTWAACLIPTDVRTDNPPKAN
ncbi:unnamed protein product, partial [Musa acuminata var. zebrina]